MTAAADTRGDEDQVAQQHDQQLQATASKLRPSPSPTRLREAATPPWSRPTPPTSLLPRLAAAFALSFFVGALYVSTSLASLSLYLLLTSTLTSPLGWTLLALLLLLATAPLGSSSETPWGFGVPTDAHAALTAPVRGLGLRFVRYVTSAAGWYFPIRVIVEGAEDGEKEGQQQQSAAASISPDGAYMIALEPHSVLPLAMPAVFSTDSTLCPPALRGRVHGLASSVCFATPLIRQLWWVLGIRPVTRRCIARLLTGRDDGAGVLLGGKKKGGKKEQEEKGSERPDAAAAGGGGEDGPRRRRAGAQTQTQAEDGTGPSSTPSTPSSLRRSVVIVPGGVQECLYMQPPETGVETAFLTDRRGFVRLAMRCGADAIVPVFSFGQSHGFSWLRPGPPLFSEAFVARVARSLGAVPLAIWGRWSTPAPYRKKMVVVVGRPLPLPRREEWWSGGEVDGSVGDPPAELVQRHLDGYIAALKELVETHRVEAGFPDATLRVL